MAITGPLGIQSFGAPGTGKLTTEQKNKIIDAQAYALRRQADAQYAMAVNGSQQCRHSSFGGPQQLMMGLMLGQALSVGASRPAMTVNNYNMAFNQTFSPTVMNMPTYNMSANVNFGQYAGAQGVFF